MVKLSNSGIGLSGEGFAGCAGSPLHLSVEEHFRGRSRSPARLAGTVLLAGGIRSKGFRAILGRNILDLPVDRERRILDLWQEQIASLSDHFGWRELRSKVLIDSGASAPQFRGSANVNHYLAIERDGRAFRGTGGVLRDACRGIDANDYILVCNAFQILYKPLTRLVERLLDASADLSFTKEPCGGAGSVFLIRGGCLTAIPEVGFVDFKEQAISLIARSHRVRVVEASERSALPV